MVIKKPTKSQTRRIAKFLRESEEIVFVTSIGNRYFWLNTLALLPLSLIFIGLPKLSHLVRMRQSYTYALTNRRFLIIRGLFSRKIVTAPLSAITHVTVEQSVMQRFLFNSGHLVIITAGFDQREIVIENIGNPVEFKILIEDLTEKLADLPQDSTSDESDTKEWNLRALSL